VCGPTFALHDTFSSFVIFQKNVGGAKISFLLRRKPVINGQFNAVFVYLCCDMRVSKGFHSEKLPRLKFEIK